MGGAKVYWERWTITTLISNEAISFKRHMKAGPTERTVSMGFGIETSRFREEVLNWKKKGRVEGGDTILGVVYLRKETQIKTISVLI